MMHTILASDAVSPPKAAIGAPLYGDTYAPSQMRELYETATYSQNDDITYYSRYWHGYRVWLKPLFIFFHINKLDY